jgi:hypothetical protein
VSVTFGDAGPSSGHNLSDRAGSALPRERRRRLRGAYGGGADAGVFGEVLASAWAAEYRLLVPAAELVDVDLGTLTYLFDLTAERTLGVYGRSDPTTAPRPAARLRGHPSYNRAGQPSTDRGHLAAHTIGGGADINLVAQDHLLNVSGAWRSFERYAQRHTGTAFAVQARYLASEDRPHAFDYSMIRGGRFVYREFTNAPPARHGSAEAISSRGEEPEQRVREPR